MYTIGLRPKRCSLKRRLSRTHCVICCGVWSPRIARMAEQRKVPDACLGSFIDCETFRSKKGTVDDLWRFAKIDRVSKVIQPYLEALV